MLSKVYGEVKVMERYKYMNKFRLDDEVIIITGASGFLGVMHTKAIIEAGGIAIMIDIDASRLEETSRSLKMEYAECKLHTYTASVTNMDSMDKIRSDLMEQYGHIDGLINNACNNPTMKGSKKGKGRFETFTKKEWIADTEVGLYGAICCSQIFGEVMARQGGGVILNIASDLGIVAPNQNLYVVDGSSEEEQPKKPVTYSTTKWGIIGLTKYLSTYWAEKNVRANAVAFGGVFNDQDEHFLYKVKELIPMGRLAERDEYIGSIIYLLSDASSYMTGSVVTIDGGRTAW